MEQKTVFSGIKPSGDMHLGNYIGAISQWVNLQEDTTTNYKNFFCIVDLHSITVPQDPNELKGLVTETAAWYLASGIDPEKSVIFVQSHNPDHPYMAWILNCFTSIGQLNRMTQFKDKSSDNEFVSAGLFDYPVLMAADILLYDADLVPVGEDQKQHIELTRDIAERFNNKHPDSFVLPDYMPPTYGKRIMSLQKPTEKMSKSIDDINGTIYLKDDADTIRKKIKSSVTDTGNEIKIREDKPAISNLINIFIALSEKTEHDLDSEYTGKGYKQFKEDLAEVVVEKIKPVQEKYSEIVNSNQLKQALEKGAQDAKSVSSVKIAEIKNKVGFI